MSETFRDLHFVFSGLIPLNENPERCAEIDGLKMVRSNTGDLGRTYGELRGRLGRIATRTSTPRSHILLRQM